ncbi:MAG: hypothetical protein M3430_04820 [Acidobacteriota bacterium]|nr:hypothetical protein [Acidobacteriota bacterium]
MTICPCCGSKFEGDLERDGCSACGARAVGPPLARPAHELPSYGHALASGVGGALLLVVFVATTLAALVTAKSSSINFWDVVAAGEVAAWQLKWLLFPAAALVVWMCVRARRKIVRQPARYTGLSAARAGFSMATIAAAAVALLIGVTIPERLRQRELALQAADDVVRHASNRMLLGYMSRHGSLPTNVDELIKDLRNTPDPDGTLAKVIAEMQAGVYSPEASLASVPEAAKKKSARRISSVRMRSVSDRAAAADDTPGQSISFTNYELVLPGRDKILGTPDDLRIRDGLMIESPTPSNPTPRATTVGKISKP